MHGLLSDCFDMDPALFFKVWLWLMQEFAPYRKYDPDTIDTVSGFVFDVRISDMEDEACSAYFEMILSYFAKHDELLVRVIGELERLDYCIPFLFYHAITPRIPQSLCADDRADLAAKRRCRQKKRRVRCGS